MLIAVQIGLPSTGRGKGAAAAPDVTAPTVVSFSPLDNATGVAITTSLAVTFNEAVVLGAAGNVTLKKTSDNSTIEAWNVATEAGTGAGQVNVVGGNVLTMRLTASLANSIEHYVIWDAGVVKDGSNNNVAAQASTTLWSFTTAAAGSAYDPASDLIFAAFTTPPTTQRKTDIDTYVSALKTAGVWAKLDTLYAFAAADSQAAKINWVSPSTFACTEVNVPAFVADRGFTGNGTTSYLDTTFNPATASSPKWLQDSACMFGWTLTNAQPVFVTGTSGGQRTVTPRSSTNNFNIRINQGTVSAIASTDSTGLFSGTRSGASATESFKNGISVTTSVIASAAVVNETTWVSRNSANYGVGQVAIVGMGSHLNATEQTALYNATNTYLTAVGALGPVYQAETNAIAAAFTTPPTTARKDLIDACVVSLKSAGVWTKLDALYASAAADSQAAKINWKAPGTFNATEVNAPAFVADRGFTGAASKYIDSGFNPTTAVTPQFVQNSATIFTHLVTNVQTASAVMGYLSAAPAIYLQPRHTNDSSSGHMNQVSADIIAASTDSSGFWTLTRTASNLTTNYRNGSSIGSHAQASIAPSNANITILANNATYWPGQSAAAGIGSGLTGSDVTALYNALRTYMTGVGVP